MRCALGALAAGCFVLAPQRAAHAQSVHGTVLEAETRAPIPGTIVFLLDTAGGRLARTLADEAGRFRLRAPVAGRYQLRTQRIGFRSVTSPRLDLGAGTPAEYTFQLPSLPIVLPVATVAERRQCVVDPGEGLLVAALWSEARKALTAAEVTQAERRFGVTLAHYERELDPRTLALREGRTWEQSGVSENPYASLPAESLAAGGYVRTSRAGTWYHAPDARVLLSDEFARDHCFRLHDGGRPGLRGVAFEPARRGPSGHTDIRGVFWLDSLTSELRHLEYGYAGLPRYVPEHRVGGRVEFRRLPEGAWVVQRWWIRMPTVAVGGRPNRDAGFRYGQDGGGRVTAIREVGGEVVRSYALGAGNAPPGSLASVEGTVTDSTRGAPLAGASVSVASPGGAARQVVADARGAFRLDSLADGEHTLTARHPRLDSLGAGPIVRAVEVARGTRVSTTLATPSKAAILAGLCPAAAAGAASVVHGVVRDAATGAPLPGARVTVRWEDGGPDAARQLHVDADSAGRYRACALPGGRVVAVQGATGTRSSEARRVRLEAGDLAFAELVVAAGSRVMARGSQTPPAGRDPQLLPTLRTEARRDLTGFEERKRRRSGGRFITGDEIERQGLRRTTDVLQMVPGIVMRRDGEDYVVTMRRTLKSEKICPIQFWVDGQPVEIPPSQLDATIAAQDIQAVEVYEGVSQVPARFAGFKAGCGVVLFWTRDAVHAPGSDAGTAGKSSGATP